MVTSARINLTLMKGLTKADEEWVNWITVGEPRVCGNCGWDMSLLVDTWQCEWCLYEEDD